MHHHDAIFVKFKKKNMINLPGNIHLNSSRILNSKWTGLSGKNSFIDAQPIRWQWELVCQEEDDVLERCVLCPTNRKFTDYNIVKKNTTKDYRNIVRQLTRSLVSASNH